MAPGATGIGGGASAGGGGEGAPPTPLATEAETLTGTATDRAVTPAGLKAKTDLLQVDIDAAASEATDATAAATDAATDASSALAVANSALPFGVSRPIVRALTSSTIQERADCIPVGYTGNVEYDLSGFSPWSGTITDQEPGDLRLRRP